MFLITSKREKCGDAVRYYPDFLEYVPYWFVTQQQLKLWHDDQDYCNDDKLIEWYNGHKNKRLKKSQ